MAERLKVAAETGNINDLYESIKEDPHVLDRIDAIPFVDTPLHIAASAGHTDFALEILRLKPSFGRKLNPDGLSSLHLALKNDKFETVKRLIKFDKELIRVKGREGANPLHYIAKKASDGDQTRMDEPINADQQQRGTEEQQRALPNIEQVRVAAEQERVADDRINILGKFLFAYPNSIEDLTIRDETPLHIAVKTKNRRAVQVILGCICRIGREDVLAYRDEKGKNALDMAEDMAESRSQLEIARSLRSAGALKSSSPRPGPSLTEFLNSPQRTWEVLFKLGIRVSRSVSMELRSIGLVVAVLIATATFLAVLTPPGGVGGPGNDNLLTNGSSINATVSSTNYLFAANTSFINATFFIPTTDHPVKGLIGRGQATYGDFFSLFYFLNTWAFILSMLMIMFALPIWPFAPLHAALFALMWSYGVSFSVISPSNGYSDSFLIVSIVCALLIYSSRAIIYRILLTAKPTNKRLRMLKRLMNNVRQ